MVYSFRKPEKLEHCLVFWNTKTGEKYAKAVKNLLHVAACRDLALLAAEVDENPGEVCTYIKYMISFVNKVSHLLFFLFL